MPPKRPEKRVTVGWTPKERYDLWSYINIYCYHKGITEFRKHFEAKYAKRAVVYIHRQSGKSGPNTRSFRTVESQIEHAQRNIKDGKKERSKNPITTLAKLANEMRENPLDFTRERQYPRQAIPGGKEAPEDPNGGGRNEAAFDNDTAEEEEYVEPRPLNANRKQVNRAPKTNQIQVRKEVVQYVSDEDSSELSEEDDDEEDEEESEYKRGWVLDQDDDNNQDAADNYRALRARQQASRNDNQQTRDSDNHWDLDASSSSPRLPNDSRTHQASSTSDDHLIVGVPSPDGSHFSADPFLQHINLANIQRINEENRRRNPYGYWQSPYHKVQRMLDNEDEMFTNRGNPQAQVTDMTQNSLLFRSRFPTEEQERDAYQADSSRTLDIPRNAHYTQPDPTDPSLTESSHLHESIDLDPPAPAPSPPSLSTPDTKLRVFQFTRPPPGASTFSPLRLQVTNQAIAIAALKTAESGVPDTNRYFDQHHEFLSDAYSEDGDVERRGSEEDNGEFWI